MGPSGRDKATAQEIGLIAPCSAEYSRMVLEKRCQGARRAVQSDVRPDRANADAERVVADI